jgi:hypothetical protein
MSRNQVHIDSLDLEKIFDATFIKIKNSSLLDFHPSTSGRNGETGIVRVEGAVPRILTAMIWDRTMRYFDADGRQTFPQLHDSQIAYLPAGKFTLPVSGPPRYADLSVGTWYAVGHLREAGQVATRLKPHDAVEIQVVPRAPLRGTGEPNLLDGLRHRPGQRVSLRLAIRGEEQLPSQDRAARGRTWYTESSQAVSLTVWNASQPDSPPDHPHSVLE